MRRQRFGWRAIVVLAATVIACGAAGAVALARGLAAPTNTNPPTIGGTAREGNTVTATNGTWTNSPTSFAYQWRRCATDGTACGDISGATKQTYVPVAGDVSHTPNSVKPAVSGSAQVGEELTVSNGT